MKITKKQLRKIIQEEMRKALKEYETPEGDVGGQKDPTGSGLRVPAWGKGEEQGEGGCPPGFDASPNCTIGGAWDAPSIARDFHFVILQRIYDDTSGATGSLLDDERGRVLYNAGIRESGKVLHKQLAQEFVKKVGAQEGEGTPEEEKLWSEYVQKFANGDYNDAIKALLATGQKFMKAQGRVWNGKVYAKGQKMAAENLERITQKVEEQMVRRLTSS